MIKYYYPITNEQFNQLINFGKIFVSPFLLVEHSANSAFVQTTLVNTFIKYIQFKYDEEYLVLEINSTFSIKGKQLQININEVENVFPISEECNKALSLKHPKIKFSSPIFSIDSLTKINDTFFTSDSTHGADCLISTFKNLFDNNNNNKVINDQIIQSAIKFRTGHKINSLKEDCSLIDFVFLYVYQAYYPLTSLGYFYRTAEILTRKALVSKNTTYSQGILERTEIYKLLNELNKSKPESTLLEIITFLEDDIRAKKFIENLTSETVKYFIVIPMFLMIIDEFNEQNQNLEKTSLESLILSFNNSYKSECQELVCWIGAFLGYGNCYDYYYSKSNLKFFKTYKQIVNIQDNENITDAEHKTIIVKSEPKKGIENIKTAGKVPTDNPPLVYEVAINLVAIEDTKPKFIVNELVPEINKANIETAVDIFKEKTLQGDIRFVEFSKDVTKNTSTASDVEQQILLDLLLKNGPCSLVTLAEELNKIQKKNDNDDKTVKKTLSKMPEVKLFTKNKNQMAHLKMPQLFDNT